jgi:tRNA (guanine37-N1)-methyltransferase
MKIDVITLFPKMFYSPFKESMIRKAIDKKILKLKIHNLRDWALDSYGTVDDKPFGGGIGMLLRPEPIYEALEEIKKEKSKRRRIILMSAKGKRLTQKKVEELARYDSLVLIAGHYEGFDQRIADHMVDEEISIGDYVLTGGELASMVVIDSVTRLLPGVLGKDESSQIESWSEIEIDNKKVRTKEYPQYTRPREFNGHTVPEVLLSGDPKKIEEWQKKKIKEELKESTTE